MWGRSEIVLLFVLKTDYCILITLGGSEARRGGGRLDTISLLCIPSVSNSRSNNNILHTGLYSGSSRVAEELDRCKESSHKPTRIEHRNWLWQFLLPVCTSLPLPDDSESTQYRSEHWEHGYIYTHLANNEEHGKSMYKDILCVKSTRTTQGCLNWASVYHMFWGASRGASFWQRFGEGV